MRGGRAPERTAIASRRDVYGATINAAVVLITFFSNGNFQDKIIPDSENSNLQQYITLLLWMLIAGVSYFRRTERTLEPTVGFYFGLGPYALAVVSLLWSHNPGETLSKVVALCIALFGAFRLVKAAPFDEVVESVIHGLFLLNAASVFLSLFVPDIGILTDWQHAGQWNGIFESKQTLGICGAVLLFFSSWRLLEPPRRLYHVLTAIAAIACVIGSGSRGGGALALVAVACVYAASVSTRFAKILAFAPFVMTLFGVALISYFLVTGDMYLELFGEKLDFTERTFIWQYALSYFGNAPLLGYGLNAFWTLGEVKALFLEQHGWFLDNFHDGYIAILMEMGAAGLGMFSLGYLAYAFRALEEINRSGRLAADLALALVYTCLIFFIDFTETFFLRSTNITATLLVVAIFIAYSRARSPAREASLTARSARRWREEPESLHQHRAMRARG